MILYLELERSVTTNVVSDPPVSSYLNLSIERKAAGAALNGAAAATGPDKKPLPNCSPHWARRELDKLLATGGDPAIVREHHAAACEFWRAHPKRLYRG